MKLGNLAQALIFLVLSVVGGIIIIGLASMPTSHTNTATDNKTNLATLPEATKPKIASLPFTWKEGGKLFNGSYIDAVEITIWNFTYAEPSPYIENYSRYIVHYTVKYTLYKPWYDFGAYRATVGPCLELKTDVGHTYGRNSDSIALYSLGNFKPNAQTSGTLSFDVRADETPIELYDYEGDYEDFRIAYIFKLNTTT